MKKLILICVLLAGCECPPSPPSQPPPFKGGEVVKLNSGGPNMTVVRDVSGNSMVRVEWLDVKGRLQSNSFYQYQLTKVKDNQ